MIIQIIYILDFTIIFQKLDYNFQMNQKSYVIFYLLYLVIIAKRLTYLYADFIYQGGHILPMRTRYKEVVNAMAIKDGKILAVGPEAWAYQNQLTIVVDLQKKAIIPGFVDAHSHFSLYSVIKQFANLYPPPQGNVDNYASLIKNGNQFYLSHVPLSGYLNWIVGFGYDHACLLEQDHPKKQHLNLISAVLPVLIVHQSFHIGSINTRGLQLLGKIVRTPQGTFYPPDPRYRRITGSDQVNGIVQKHALQGLLDEIHFKLTDIWLQNAFLSGQGIYISKGYTTIQDSNTFVRHLDIFISMAIRKKFKTDLYVYPDADSLKLRYGKWDSYIGNQYKNNFRIGGGYLKLDGNFQLESAYLNSLYRFSVLPSLPYYKTTTLLSHKIKDLIDHGVQPIVYANGDGAIGQLLSVVQNMGTVTTKLRKNLVYYKPPPGFHFSNLDQIRIVVLHCQMVTQNQLDKMVDLNLIPSFFGVDVFLRGDWYKRARLGESAQRLDPARSALKRNMLFTQNTHSLGMPPDPWRVIQSIVTRNTRNKFTFSENQTLSVYQALLSMTIYPAFQIFEQNRKGSLQSGKNADFLILSQDPLECEHQRLSQIKVLKSFKNNVKIYESLEKDPSNIKPSSPL